MVEIQGMMTKKYSLSKNEIVAQEQGIIRDICASVLSNNRDLHLLDDLVQDINVILLTQLEETIQSLYETNQLRYFVARVVTNQVLSTSSPFHKTYRLRDTLKCVSEDDYDDLADRIWEKVIKSNDKVQKDIVILRFEYSFKIKEIALIQNISTRYVHRLLNRVYEELRKNY